MKDDSKDDQNLQQKDQGEELSNSFMTFAPKSSVSINRRYTQKKQPPNVTEFMTEFEQERRSSPPRSPIEEDDDSITNVKSNMMLYDDAQDFSDTARLTINASSISGFYNQEESSNSQHYTIDKPTTNQNKFNPIHTKEHNARISFQHGRPVSKMYEPAYIDPELEQKSSRRKMSQFIYFDKKVYIESISKTIRQVSRRVVNVHNIHENHDFSLQIYRKDLINKNSEQLSLMKNVTAQHNEEDGNESDTSSHVNEIIPMTLTSSNIHCNTTSISQQNITAASTTTDYTNIAFQQENKRFTKLSGKSLKLFSPTNSFRLLFAKILFWKWFETFIMLLLVLHGTVLLVVGWGSNPYPNPPSEWTPTWDQIVLLVIFSLYTLTTFCRIIVYGLIINSDSNFKTAFLRHSWNRIDFVSIIAYWIDLILLLTHQEIIGDYRRILVFKTLSALILFRLLNLTDGSKVILNSLKKAAPLLVNVLFFVLFFFVIFAIVGVQSFEGSFKRHCVWHDPNNASNTQELQQYCGGYINASGAVVPYKLKDGTSAPWSKGFICENGLICEETENPFGGTISFDNIFSSMLIVMIITGVQSWTDRMYDMMDAEYFIACLYFVIIVIVMNLWLINLFIAVITEMFAKVREDSQHSAFTNSKARPVLADTKEEEGEWAFSEQDNTQTKASKNRSKLASIVKYMKPFWIILVVIDLFCMASKNINMTEAQIAALNLAETIFTFAFLFEIILRMLSQRKNLKEFFEDKFNFTDFFIALITTIIQIPPNHKNEFVYVWFTGFQVLRIYRLVVAIPRLRKLMSRVLGSVHGLINLTFFIILATLICAIIAFQLLEGVINDPEDSPEMRFFSVYNSFVGLYQLFSGEDWTTVLYSIMEAGSNNGNSAIYALFLVFWFAFSNFVLVNMFIAVLMENFEIAEEDKRKRQVLQFMEKTENELDKNTVVSRWNLYRYFKPKAKGLDIKNIPSNLILSVQKSIVREFMNEATESNINESPMIHSKIDNHNIEKYPNNGILGKIQNFLTQLFTSSSERKQQQQQQHKQRQTNSLYIDSINVFDQVGTFYDFKKRGATHDLNEPRSLRYLVDPTLRETVASRYQQEIIDLDIEERKALKRDFIAAHPTYDKSLYLFSSRNPIRRWCQLIVPPSRGERIFGTRASKWGSIIFLTFITCCVIANVVLTIYNSPVYQYEHRNDRSAIMPFIYADWAFTVIFTFEFVVKVIADGLLFTPNAYLLNGWNILDLFVLITLYMSNFGNFAASTGLERGFRAFKALRALRLINLLGPAKETFSAILVTGLPQIFDAAVLGLCLIVPFAIYGQNIFMGLFYYCNDGEGNKIECIYERSLGTQEPMPDDTSIYMPRVWNNPYVYSFDSFWKSLLILFEIASGEGWIDVMTTSMSITGRDQAPQQDASQLWGIFFMVYNLAGSVFVISLFLGVVIENFTKRNGTAYLTSDQRRWLDLKKLLNQIRPAKRPKIVPKNRIRKLCYDLTVEKRGKFYKLITVVIILNIIFLCMDTANKKDTYSTDNDPTGWGYIKGFIFIYWLEILIKLLGLGWNSFRQNLWNLFDFIMVIGSFITAIITLSNPYLQVNIESQKLFMTALCFKLVQRSDSLNQLFTTMAASSYRILNVFAVWFIVLTTYAIMFMQIFGLTKYGPNATTEHVNFRTYSNTMISLIRYSTGEGWNSIMHDFTVEYPHCVLADDYLDSDCGSLRWSYFLFLTFNIISMYIFIAIFVAVVADNFSYVYQIRANFSLMTWASIDTNRTGYILPNQYIIFWKKLEGIFNIRIFEPEFSYKNLVKTCTVSQKSIDNTNDTRYQHHLDLKALNSKLNLLNRQEIHLRRQDLEKIYWETALIESSSKGVSFNQMLLMLAQRKLIVPENALVLEELLENQKKEEAIHTLISIDRVRGLLETIALRKKFLKYLDDKKQKNIPTIVINENDKIQPQMNDIKTCDEISTANRSHNSFYDLYLSSDEDESHEDIENEDTIATSRLDSSSMNDNMSYSIWEDMLKEETQ
ncbi:Ion transport protein-domain-containing protein [Cokeromyces recurvatus]|uniref:Ion transport protein-domain-containing protein n=1 Tax=Cokeromyces recurvatus TaxID=90255 RepID=UPI00221EE3FA|nr:Ion transport protein-domain-containing protein [Cokeromyces recurvatus]KAI7905468.1 Ion transport protein-domain-containing protein [Cokeromyces recurvatus]